MFRSFRLLFAAAALAVPLALAAAPGTAEARAPHHQTVQQQRHAAAAKPHHHHRQAHVKRKQHPRRAAQLHRAHRPVG